MSDRPMPTDTTASLLDLLTLSSTPHAPEVIFSTVPELWLGADLPEQAQLYDISALVGKSGLATSLSSLHHSRVEEYVLAQLLSLGWPRELIRFEYRSESSRASSLDMALLDPSGSLLAGIEVLSGMRRLGSMLGARGRDLLNFSGAPRIYVTDGHEHLQIDRDGERCLDQLPPPSQFGVTAGIPASADRLYHAVDWGWLRAMMDSLSPQHVVLDHTIPWGVRVSPESRLQELVRSIPLNVPRLDMSGALLAWAASLGSVHVISTVAAPSLTWAGAMTPLREFLNGQVGVAAHIELPAGTFRPAAGIRASYLLLGRHRNEVYFDSLTSPGDLVSIREKAWYLSYSNWLKGRSADRGFTKPSEGLRSWSVAQNHPHVDAVRDRVRELGPIRSLGELCEIFASQIRPNTLTSEADDDLIEVIDSRRLRDATSDEDRKYLSPEVVVQERDFLIGGDVLIPRMQTPSARAIQFISEGRAVAGSSVVVLRSTGEVDARYLVEYLNSSTGRTLLQQLVAGTGIPQLSIGLLREMPVPLIQVDFARSIEQVDSAYDALVAIADELEAGRSSLFDSAKPQDLSRQLNELKRRSLLVSDTLKLTESLEFQISQFFPYPLAYGYRLLAGYVDARQKVQEQLRVAENILAFLASASLALLDDEDRKSLASNFRGIWRSGASPGDWKDMIQQASGRFRTYRDHPLAESIAKLEITSERRGFGKEALFLINTKNDYKHDRGPKTDADFERNAVELDACLNRVMQYLTFWTRYPIRQVQQIDIPRRSPRVQVKCLRVVGDHPGFRQEQVAWHEPLRRKDLYLEISERKWLALFPFIQTHVCERCKFEEIYFVDRWDGHNRASIKSFERGHSETSSETADELRYLFLASNPTEDS